MCLYSRNAFIASHISFLRIDFFISLLHLYTYTSIFMCPKVTSRCLEMNTVSPFFSGSLSQSGTSWLHSCAFTILFSFPKLRFNFVFYVLTSLITISSQNSHLCQSKRSTDLWLGHLYNTRNIFFLIDYLKGNRYLQGSLRHCLNFFWIAISFVLS